MFYVIFDLVSFCVRRLDVEVFTMLQGRDTTSKLGEHCASSVFTVVECIVTLFWWQNRLFDADARSLDRRLELSVIGLDLLNPLELIIYWQPSKV